MRQCIIIPCIEYGGNWPFCLQMLNMSWEISSETVRLKYDHRKENGSDEKPECINNDAANCVQGIGRICSKEQD